MCDPPRPHPFASAEDREVIWRALTEERACGRLSGRCWNCYLEDATAEDYEDAQDPQKVRAQAYLNLRMRVIAERQVGAAVVGDRLCGAPTLRQTSRASTKWTSTSGGDSTSLVVGCG